MALTLSLEDYFSLSSIDEQAGVAYTDMILSNEGQALVEKAGFVPLH